MEVSSDECLERREQKGTWPWFALNVLLFPAPAHFTLLRIKEFSFGRSLKHLGVTILLISILLMAASFQLVFPAVGRMWMLLPVLSGVILLYVNRSLRGTFTPIDLRAVGRDRWYFILFCVLVFTAISTLPSLDLITLKDSSRESYQSWLRNLPLWQNVIILAAALLLLYVGYITNSVGSVSINRAIILYACLFVFSYLLLVISLLVFNWLKIQGGFWTQFIMLLLGAVLALDYWDAKTFGQYTRRFFFLTCTKGSTFLFLVLCLSGLPQKSASTFSAYYFDKSRPAVVEGLDGYLLFSHNDRFRSAHRASRQLRSMFAKAFYSADSEDLRHINALLHGKKGSVFPADADVCRLSDLIREKDIQSTAMPFDRVPVFRPIHPEWDVMLTALLMQGTISKKDLNNCIADFKAMIPKTSQGRLPGIGTAYNARYVALATDTHVDFLPPQFEMTETLLENGIYPVLSLRLAGKDYWAALLNIDKHAGLVWFRIELVGDTGTSIQTLFDANESEKLESEILSRSLIPLSLSYFQNYLKQASGLLLAFTRDGLSSRLPKLFSAKDLSEMNRAVAFANDPQRHLTPVPGNLTGNPFTAYARYIRTVSHIKALLWPGPYNMNLFSLTEAPPVVTGGLDRLKQIEALLEQIEPIRDSDRVDIAYFLVNYNHVGGAPELFIRLTTGKQISSDLIDCRDGFRIGRELFLLGLHKEAYPYLELAFSRHPFDIESELWYHIARAKLNMPKLPFYSPPEHEPHLYMYYRTLVDMKNGRDKAALNRLEATLENDSHNSLAVHLLSKYFGKPLDERHFFPAQEGL